MTQMICVISIVMLMLTYTCLGFGNQDKIVFRNNDNVNDGTETLPGNSCITPNGSPGECISILKCPVLLALIPKRDQHEFLKQSRCGWDGNYTLVCCSNETPTTTQRQCTISDLHWCESGKFDECCIPKLTYNIEEYAPKVAVQPMNNGLCEISSMPPEPSLGCCGQESSNFKINRGEVAQIDEYPWTATIEYVRNAIIQLKCGGALISARYVLTAAHCMYINKWTPINIRLGDYDIVRPGIDCVLTESGDENCTDGAVTISIEKTIPHPDYSAGSRAQTDDIALIRMTDSAPYTDFIRPICLPSVLSDFTETADSSTILYIAGWGVTHYAQSYNQLKLREELPYVTSEDCFISYRKLSIILSEGQICTSGDKNRNPCKGDSGGALMLKQSERIEVVGIASFSPCGSTNRPSVYTKVLHYLPWIRNTIK